MSLHRGLRSNIVTAPSLFEPFIPYIRHCTLSPLKFDSMELSLHINKEMRIGWQRFP